MLSSANWRQVSAGLTPSYHRALATFSVPFPTGFCLLQADVLRDTIRFGIWGYCFQDSGVCSPKGLGYQWDPEIIVWMTKVLVLIPVGAMAPEFQSAMY